MSSSAPKLFFFLAIGLLFFRAKSQVISKSKAEHGTLNHLVHLSLYHFYFSVSGAGIIPSEGAGTIVKLNWVLTAAHNVANYNETVNGTTTLYRFKAVKILAGTKDVNDESARAQRRTSKMYDGDRKSIIIHEDHDPESRLYDVALIYVKEKFDLTDTVRPAKLLEKGVKFDPSAKCVVQGWGLDTRTTSIDGRVAYTRSSKGEAMQGTVHLLNGWRCRQYVDERRRPCFDGKNQFCYGCNYGTCEQTAQGDSGTALVCALAKGESPLRDGVVFAVHSYGCTDPRYKCTSDGPSVGIDVREIKQWIDTETQEGILNKFAVVAGALTLAAAVVLRGYF